jgi:hypothetical protein
LQHLLLHPLLLLLLLLLLLQVVFLPCYVYFALATLPVAAQYFVGAVQL